MRELYNEMATHAENDYDNWIIQGMKADAAEKRAAAKKRKDKEKRRDKRKRTGR